jgi:predicted Zn-dependent protease with MMP-like domain
MIVSPDEFDAWIQEALAGLPTRFARLAEDVSIVTEEEPSAEILKDLELESEDDLLGLYQGVPIDEKSFFQPAGELPARIAIYRGPILRLCRTKAEVIQEVRDTVVHELGHHVGLDDDEMPY